MKKLFFAICFNLLYFSSSLAAITPVSGYDNIKPQTQTVSDEVKEITVEELKDMVGDYIKNPLKVDVNNINRNFGYIPSTARELYEKEQKKGFFQKVYEQALERVSASPDVNRSDIITPSQEIQKVEPLQQQAEWNTPSIPYITAYLPPNNTAFTIPALEHIPYLMNSIEVLQSGMVKFEETIVVVANGEKLRDGLTKILPLKIYNAQGKSKKLDYSIIGVKVNDMPVNYHLVSNGRNTLLVPDNDYHLVPGVYTYKFEYLVDNLLWDYGDYYQLYWDVGGNGWNLIIDRLGASLGLPQRDGILRSEILLGSAQGLQNNLVDMSPNGPFAEAYIAKRPLFIGEGMHLIADIDKAVLFPETIWQKITRAFYSYGDVYLSLLGLLVIFISFFISWKYITKDKKQLKLSLNKTAMVIRYLLFNRFDIKSMCGFLLELYKKNIIDIQQSGDTILLIKRTDNLKSLAAFEQKALKQLFPSHETTFNISSSNMLPLKRFAGQLERGLRLQMLKFKFKLNLGYLLFSFAMLLLTEIFISFFTINSGYVFGVLIAATIGCFFAVALWRFGKNKWLKILARLVSLDIIFMSLVAFSAVVNPLAALLLILSVITIITALEIYSKRLGLIKHYIQDIAKQKDYLLQHHDNILLGKDFLNYQAAILAFDIEDEFINGTTREYNKLPIIKNIMKCIQ